ncbi:MAG: polymer-forming cytoskeletal protein [Patescibacteria group bacterium]
MKKILLTSLVLGLFLPLSTNAALFLHEKDGNVSVKRDTEIRENVYVAGKSVSIQQIIFGDALAAGATVLVSENISDDAWLLGATVSLLGAVGGDARIAGSNVLVNSLIVKDLMVAGGTVTISSKTNIGGDLIIAGGIVTFDGIAAKTARIIGGEIVINGTINGDVSVKADEKLSFGPDAKIKGNLNYKSKKEVEIPTGVVTGKVTFEEKAGRGVKENKNSASWVGALIAGFATTSFLMMLIGALFLFFFMPKFANEVTTNSLTKTGQSMLRGFITAIVMPIAGIILLATILGWFIGWGVLAVFALLIILSKASTALVAGSLIAKWVKRDEALHLSWKTITIGALVLSLLCFIPILGWLILALIWLISFGAVVTYFYEKLWLNSRN